MPSDRFEKFLPFILKWECVFKKGHDGDFNYIVTENVAGDGGGRTFAGIDEAAHPSFDFVHPTLEKAKEVYWQEWQKFGIERYTSALGECVFNCAVNCGISRANKILAQGVRDAAGFLDSQEDFYRRLVEAKPGLRKFLKGWLNRTSDLRKFLGV